MDGAVSPPSSCLAWGAPALCQQAAGWGQFMVLMSWRENSTLALSSTSVHMVNKLPQNDCCQCLCPQGELQLPPDSKRLSRIARYVWLGLLSNYCFFPRSQSLWDFVSFKSGVSISHSHLFGFPQSKLQWPSKPNVLRAYLPGTGALACGTWYVAQSPCSFGRTSAIVIVVVFVGCSTLGFGS